MGNSDTLKTAKIRIQAEEQSLDGHHCKRVRKPKKSERQKGKSIIRKELEQKDE